MLEAVLGLGTNLGDRLGSLRHGVRALRRRTDLLRVSRISPIYESDALTPPGAPPEWHRPYLNLAASVRFAGTVDQLLATTKAIEVELGRAPRARWAPRELDIDILAAGDLIRSDDRVTIPHRGLADRPFALLPFRDVAPEWRFPDGIERGRTAAEVASRWAVDPEHVPFRTRRVAAPLTELVGIVNVTPDSFSDGNRWTDPDLAVSRGRELAAAGATVLDFGGESTRPGALPVAAEEEIGRLEAAVRRTLEARARSGGLIPLVSVDTRHPEVARAAIGWGVDWINDVTGFANPRMIEVVAGSAVRVVVMHSLGIPPTADQVLDPGRDVVEALAAWAAEKVEALQAAGIDPRRLIVDPGLGFGKTAAQNAEVVRRASELHRTGLPLLIGHSRKRFLAHWFGDGPADLTRASDRDPETAAMSQVLAAQGVDFLRVHDVAGTLRALRVGAAMAGSVGAARVEPGWWSAKS